jgi:hypothetical protein
MARVRAIPIRAQTTSEPAILHFGGIEFDRAALYCVKEGVFSAYFRRALLAPPCRKRED